MPDAGKDDAPLLAKPRQEYISRKREEFAVAGSQTATHAFGTPYLRSCSLDAVLSWIAFLFICWPIGVVLVLSGCCCGPLLFQRFAMWCLTGPLRNSLLGVLLMRIPSLTYDLAMNGYQFLFQGFEQRMWTDTLLPARREYLDANFGRNLMLWDTVRIGDYGLAREIALDPHRKRAGCLDGWLIKGATLPQATNLPLFFHTGAEYHTAWRKAFREHITGEQYAGRCAEPSVSLSRALSWSPLGAPSVVAKLKDGGRAAREEARPHLNAWLASGWGGIQPPAALGSRWMAQPVFETLASLLLDVRPTALEGEAKEAWDDLITKVAIYTTVGALYWLLPPSYPPLLQTAGTLAPSALKRFLYLHCNSARPEALAGRPVDWRAFADAVPGVESVTADVNGVRPSGSGASCCEATCGSCLGSSDVPSREEPKVDKLLDSVCMALLLAAAAGTTSGCSNTLAKLLRFPRGVFPKALGNSPQWTEDADEMAALFRACPTDFVIEALRLACPVAGSHKVLDKPMQCPFLDGTVTLPAESIVVANYNTAHLDPKEWGDDAMAFAPGRADHDRYLVWNGPFGRGWENEQPPAPRQCPGEEHAVAVISIVVGAFLDYHKPAGGGPPKNTRTAGDAEAASEPVARSLASEPPQSKSHPLATFCYYAFGGSQ